MTELNKNSGKVICGEESVFEEYSKGLGEFLFEYADKYRDRTYQIDYITNLQESLGSIKQRCIRLALGLAKLGATSKDVIMICSKHSMDSHVPYIGAFFLGAKTAVLHHTQSNTEWMHCLKLVHPTFIFVEEDIVTNMEKCIENLKIKPQIIVFGKSDKYVTFEQLQKPSEAEITFYPVEVQDCKDTAVVMFSSGTTGLPKGMCLSHWNIINKIVATMRLMQSNQPSVGLSYSTLYWISGLLQLVMNFYLGSTKIIPSHHYDPQEMLEIIQKYKVNFMYVSPTLIRPLFSLNCFDKYDVSSLRMFTTVGSILHENEYRKLKTIFKNAFVTQAYGCSETLTTGTAFHPFKHTDLISKINSVGKCSNDCKIKVIDPENQVLLGSNQIGVIYLKSRFCMNGYLNNNSSEYFDEDGFFKTGDLGYYDEDHCFYITGRMKESFKYRSFYIPVNYLESILLEYPDVLEAAVFGIPDKESVNLPAACVVLKREASCTVNDIEKFFTQKVSDQHKLRGGIKLVQNLPRTPTSKIQKNKLLDLFLD